MRREVNLLQNFRKSIINYPYYYRFWRAVCGENRMYGSGKSGHAIYSVIKIKYTTFILMAAGSSPAIPNKYDGIPSIFVFFPGLIPTFLV